MVPDPLIVLPDHTGGRPDPANARVGSLNAESASRMELGWLEDFLALVECTNFSRAAERRHMTQPAFSRRIRALETWIGAALFERTSHRVAPTEAGERFRPVAEELVRRLYQGREEARQAQAAAASTLRFAATHALSLTFFPAWLRSIEATARGGVVGGSAIRLVSDSMQACEQAMLQAQAEFLLCHHHPAAPPRLDPGQFRSVRIGTDRLVPLAAASGDSGRPRFALPPRAGAGAGADRPALPLLAYNPESGLGRILDAVRLVESRSVRAEPVFASHLAAVLRAMAQDGRGVAWLPRSLVEDDIKRGTLVPAGGEEWEVAVEIHVFRARSRQSPAAEAFWALIA
jgi:DNA-binding transcriptional LysR family regulator